MKRSIPEPVTTAERKQNSKHLRKRMKVYLLLGQMEEQEQAGR